MDIHLSCALCSVIGQLRTSSHQLQIEVRRYTRLPLEERICQLCHQGVESEEHYVCHCSVFYEIRGRYHCLFKQGFGPLRKVMEYEDQQRLGLFLLELKRHREKLLKNTTTLTPPQRTIITFFSPITPTNATSQSRDKQMGPRLGHKKGVTIDRAIAICRARRSRPHGPRPQHPCHRQIKAIISRPRRCFPRFEDISILDHMYRKADSLVSFYLYTSISRSIIYFFDFFDLLFSKTRQYLRCNLLFGLIDHLVS